MYKLYDFNFDKNPSKKELYYKANKEVLINEQDNIVLLEKETKIDFFTYFNSFSLSKWKKYTTINQLKIHIDFEGILEIKILLANENKEYSILKKEAVNFFDETFDIEELNEDILYIKILSKSNTCKIFNISYWGDFKQRENKKIGIVICTYKREQFVKKTIEQLNDFCNKNKWLDVLVIDNGRTLSEINYENIRLIYNHNYGGSGGFTRGIIEFLHEKKVDYILLMDDDIEFDNGILFKTYNIISTLKKEYQESFLSGAMLELDRPKIQYENTAYWRLFRLYSLGKNYNLVDKNFLLKNNKIGTHINQYAAWWYCCIPVNRILKIGLPLPMFIKGDDMEYSIRNNRELIYMNGIGVWHEIFNKKLSFTVNYFSDRNMLIINNFVGNCNRWTLMISILGRFIKRLLKNNGKSLEMLDLALNDYIKGFDFLITLNENEIFKRLKAYGDNNFKIITMVSILKNIIYCMFNYNKIKDKYINFRNKMLKDTRFWIEYLQCRR
ncbi:glycosyltransferase family 2 protein [Megamonas sp.]